MSANGVYVCLIIIAVFCRIFLILQQTNYTYLAQEWNHGGTSDSAEQRLLLGDKSIANIASSIEQAGKYWFHLCSTVITHIQKLLDEILRAVNESYINFSMISVNQGELTCSKTDTGVNLNDRFQRPHTSGNPFKCPFCGGGFHKTTDLYEHLRHHTNIKVQQCFDNRRIFKEDC